MTVIELIEKLKELPPNTVVVTDSNNSPNPEQVWDDVTENYKVIL